jgi:hypothetical protein
MKIVVLWRCGSACVVEMLLGAALLELGLAALAAGCMMAGEFEVGAFFVLPFCSAAAVLQLQCCGEVGVWVITSAVALSCSIQRCIQRGFLWRAWQCLCGWDAAGCCTAGA